MHFLSGHEARDDVRQRLMRLTGVPQDSVIVARAGLAFDTSAEPPTWTPSWVPGGSHERPTLVDSCPSHVGPLRQDGVTDTGFQVMEEEASS